jgi:hypothetical protein
MLLFVHVMSLYLSALSKVTLQLLTSGHTVKKFRVYVVLVTEPLQRGILG